MAENKLKILKNIIRESYLYVGFGLVFIFILFVLYFQLTIEPDKVKRPQFTEIHYADNITEAHLSLIEKFNKKNAGRIKVVPINLPFSKFSTNERKELLARALRSKSEKIDVFAADIIWGHRFSKWAENLEPYMPEDYTDLFIDEIMPTCYFKDSLIALPLKIDLGTMYYRDDLISGLKGYNDLEEKLAGSITWEEFIQLGKKTGEKYDPFYLFPAADYEGLICSYMELLLNQNRNFFDNDNFDLNRPEAVKALKTMQDLIYKYNLTPGFVTSMTEFPCHEHFIQSNGLFLRSWPTFVHDYRTIYKKGNPGISVKRAPLPHFKGTKPAAVFGGWNLIVSKFSENKSKAVEFIRYMLQPESQELLFGANGSLPVLKELYENSDSIDEGETLAYYREQFKYGVHRPLTADYTRISDIITYYIHKALNMEISVEEALSRATEMIGSRSAVFK